MTGIFLFSLCQAIIASSPADDGVNGNVDWALHGNDKGEQRFSELTAVNTQNVNGLGLAWNYEMGTYRGLEATPIVKNGKIFVSGNWGVVHALDAKTGKRLWVFNPRVPGKWGRYGCCDVVNRGVAVADKRVFVASFDGRLFALDSTTGEPIWEIDTIDGQPPYTITGAPRVVKDMVMIGNGGAEYGVRGYISAYDVQTGELVWRFYTVPGNPTQPFEQPELEMAAKTWTGNSWWKTGGGGTVWDSMAYDAENDLFYFGVGNGSPWPRDIRSPDGGDNLFLSSIVAVRPDTGEYVWHYQTTPADSWDFTATQHMVLAELQIDGKSRNVLMQAPKNGFFYVLDRITGELLSANNYVATNWATHVDVRTGRPAVTEMYGTDLAVILPSPAGGHNWQPMAFNPRNNLVFIPTRDLAGLFTMSAQWVETGNLPHKKGWWNIGMDWQTYTDAVESIDLERIPVSHGYLKAWDPVSQQLAWSFEHNNVWNGGVLATAGNLVFQGGGDGVLRAHNASSGDVLWTANLKTGMVAPPISYSIDGEQYVLVLAGWGGTAIAGGDPRTSAAAKYGNLGRLFAFKLGGKAKMPVIVERNLAIDAVSSTNLDDVAVAAGAVTYMEYCSVCHGPGAISSGVIPDLRRMTPATRQQFTAIVRQGQREVVGMPNFSDLLTEEDVNNVYQYVLHRTQLSANRERHN
jgi:quinohemoprotein ethanol dehydrogenase